MSKNRCAFRWRLAASVLVVPMSWGLVACTSNPAASSSAESGTVVSTPSVSSSVNAPAATSGTAIAVSPTAVGPAASQPAVEPGPTTPVPPPTYGNITARSTVLTPKMLSKTSLAATVSPAAGVDVRLKGISSVDAVSTTPGEVNGPAAQITVEIKNGTKTALDINSVEVGLTDSAAQPGIPVTTAADAPFSGQIAPGATATGVYVFRVPTNHRNAVLITVSYTAGGAVAQFAGMIK